MNDNTEKLNLINKEKIVENGKENLNSYFPFTLLGEKLYFINNENKLSFKNLSNKGRKAKNYNFKIENFNSIKTSIKTNNYDNNHLIISNENGIILFEKNLNKSVNIYIDKNINDFLSYQHIKIGYDNIEFKKKLIIIYASDEFIQRDFNGNKDSNNDLINEKDLNNSNIKNNLNNVKNLNINDDNNLFLINDYDKIIIKKIKEKKFVEIIAQEKSNFAKIIKINDKNFIYSCENDGCIRCYDLDGKIINFCYSNLKNGLFNFIIYMNKENKKKYLFINGKIKILIYDLEKNEFINEIENSNEILSILNYKNKLLIYDKDGEISSFDIGENKDIIESYYSSSFSNHKDKSSSFIQIIKKTKCSFCDLEFENNFNEHVFEKHKEEIIKKYNKNIIKNDNKENNVEYKHGKIRIENENSSEKINDSTSSDNINFTKIIIIKTKCLFCNLEIEGNFEDHLFEKHKEEIIKKYNKNENKFEIKIIKIDIIKNKKTKCLFCNPEIKSNILNDIYLKNIKKNYKNKIQ